MSSQNLQQELQEFAFLMKHDWDDRARQDAKWFINTLRFQQTDEEFDQTGAFEVERLVRADLPLLTRGRDPKSLRVLEIGCGAGRMTRHLANLFGEVVGVDVSGEMIRQARQRLRDAVNVQLHETSGVDFAALPDGHFDLILSAYVFQHVPSAAVIRSNLEDAWRVLKPNGVFRFQANAITAYDFDEIEKDTWTGASFPESNSRDFAAEQDAQLISITGADTQYCWTTLRKRTRDKDTKAQYTTGPLAIADFGRADDFSIKQIPTHGDRAYLGLLVAGLSLDEIDASSLIVEFAGERALPQYVGPSGQNSGGGQALAQVNQKLPAGLPGGEIEVRVVTLTGEASQPVTVELQEPQPVIPKIVNVRNARDEQADVLTRGKDTEVWLFVEGLDLTADPGNTRVKIGERVVKPTHIGLQPANAAYLVKVPLPANIELGEKELRLYFGALESPVWPIQIR
ncbi:MAG: methyltransferase domain-containing protein [Acidobacteriota bacterium]